MEKYRKKYCIVHLNSQFFQDKFALERSNFDVPSCFVLKGILPLCGFEIKCSDSAPVHALWTYFI